ncbi:MAG: class I SAM-dependent DNA methyltransferase [Firmicutes bacterium]|nr:class I SAM-dependent DNA methyltransferase [Bacillota bacterium]
MTDAQQREAARQFIYRWHGKGKEDEDARSYWIEILTNILGVERVTERVDFEKKVVGADGNTKRIDVYIPETHVLIEQKSLGIALDKPQAGHNGQTPYEQAKYYDNYLPHSEKARWIVTSNFEEIWIDDMDAKVPEPRKLALDEISHKFHMLDFLVNRETKELSDEMKVSLDAGKIVGELYEAFLKQYKNPDDPQILKSLNKLCVRIVFCLYAEDAGVFGRKNLFRDYMTQFNVQTARKGLRDLFRVLNQKVEERDPYLADDDPLLAAFPYVNGGLFADDDIEIPPFTEDILALLVRKASHDFDWSGISPTIFGAVFESTLNPETRRAGGMHYTSIENIHKVIDPLFLDDLKAELEEISGVAIARTKEKKLREFQDKLASLCWLDPAAGSGNFLTETYLCIRRLENEVIRLLQGDQVVLGEAINPIKVSIGQFYGIEINDFAVTVAQTALWIAENQMMQETETIVHMNFDFLPLKTHANIVEGNALRLNWEEVVPKDRLNYIMGNPPFVGYSLQSKSQKEDILSIYVDEKGKPYKTAGKIDYVAGWYWKASELMQGTVIRSALVSTNSITQGEQVASIWKPLYERFGIHIDFGYRTFRWDSEASILAHVHCVIVGFSCAKNAVPPRLYDGEFKSSVQNINAYLVDGPNVFVQSNKTPLDNVPEMTTGNRPADGGYLIIEDNEYESFINQEPSAKKYVKRLIGSAEFINNKKRWCLWLVGVSPSVLRSMPMVMKRVELCKQDRENAPDPGRRKLAERPTLFRETKNPETYIVVPAVSSEKRRYVPIGFLNSDTIPTNLVIIIPDASLYHFGVLESNVHMSWMRTVCGRLKSDYRYSKDIVYNNFPWPDPTPEQKAKIEQTAQAILDARALYPEASLADLYDELTMPPELRKAHQANDRAVMQAYGMPIKETDEAACVAWLMRLYQEKVGELEK